MRIFAPIILVLACGGAWWSVVAAFALVLGYGAWKLFQDSD